MPVSATNYDLDTESQEIWDNAESTESYYSSNTTANLIWYQSLKTRKFRITDIDAGDSICVGIDNLQYGERATYFLYGGEKIEGNVEIGEELTGLFFHCLQILQIVEPEIEALYRVLFEWDQRRYFPQFPMGQI